MFKMFHFSVKQPFIRVDIVSSHQEDEGEGKFWNDTETCFILAFECLGSPFEGTYRKEVKWGILLLSLTK